ncbi:MAG TPA: biotin/lipoyl-binding protein [Firmicutes bacterium]|nr:biotin/lipoyl-binding protein [Bacillota bacterium]
MMKQFKVTVNGKTYEVQVEEVPPPGAEAKIPLQEARTAGEQGIRDHKDIDKNNSAAPGKSIKAPLPGVILSINAAPGDKVKAGDSLLVLEAMKMENEITFSEAGTVQKILVQVGDSVNAGDTLAIVE